MDDLIINVRVSSLDGSENLFVAIYQSELEELREVISHYLGVYLEGDLYLEGFDLIYDAERYSEEIFKGEHLNERREISKLIVINREAKILRGFISPEVVSKTMIEKNKMIDIKRVEKESDWAERTIIENMIDEARMKREGYIKKIYYPSAGLLLPLKFFSYEEESYLAIVKNILNVIRYIVVDETLLMENFKKISGKSGNYVTFYLANEIYVLQLKEWITPEDIENIFYAAGLDYSLKILLIYKGRQINRGEKKSKSLGELNEIKEIQMKITVIFSIKK